MQLNNEYSTRDHNLERDTIFIIEKILGRKKIAESQHYNIKWENYLETTWEPESNIPKIFRDYCDRTGNQEINPPHIRLTKKIGNTSYYLLTWDDGSKTWVEEEEFGFTGSFSLDNNVEEFSCQTRKESYFIYILSYYHIL